MNKNVVIIKNFLHGHVIKDDSDIIFLLVLQIQSTAYDIPSSS